MLSMQKCLIKWQLSIIASVLHVHIKKKKKKTPKACLFIHSTQSPCGTAVLKVSWLHLASTIIRWIDETAEYTEAQLLERINESLQCTIQVDESTNVDKATMLVSMQYISQRMCKRVCYVPFCCQPIPQLQNYLSLWMIMHQGIWIGHFVLVYA